MRVGFGDRVGCWKSSAEVEGKSASFVGMVMRSDAKREARGCGGLVVTGIDAVGGVVAVFV